MSANGRNALCPCGSGKKYKYCCRCLDDQARCSPNPETSAIHERDNSLAVRVLKHMTRRFGAGWIETVSDNLFADSVPDELEFQLLVPWAIYHHRTEQKTSVEWFMSEHETRLGERDRALLAAQQVAWLSIWEVTGVEEGVGLSVTDLLTGERRFVLEGSGSRILVMRDAVLGRVLDFESRSVFSGIYPRPLPPAEAADLVDLARASLRSVERPVPPARLRDELVGLLLVHGWAAAVQELDNRPFKLKLRNTDGDPLRLTVDRFDLAPVPGARAEVMCRLQQIGDVKVDEDEPKLSYMTFLRPGNKKHKSWDNTIIGNARLTDDQLELETNSTKRANDLRRRVESKCDALVIHRGREQTDPNKALEQGLPPEQEPAAARLPEELQVIREFKARQFEGWVEENVPVLGGLTPREAVKTQGGRRQVEVLLKEFENHESRLPKEERIDLTPVRRKLGISV